jgi:hypothetical protein
MLSVSISIDGKHDLSAYKDFRAIWATKGWSDDSKPDVDELSDKRPMREGDVVEVKCGFGEDLRWERGVVTLSNWDGSSRVNVLLDNGEVRNYLSKVSKQVQYASSGKGKQKNEADSGGTKVKEKEDKSKKEHPRSKISGHVQRKYYHEKAVSHEYSKWNTPQSHSSNYKTFRANSGHGSRKPRFNTDPGPSLKSSRQAWG